ncbi:MAG: MFS transporter [Streptosporangiales bacterium]|nr:MFS transporter [Streptosporangiales bacterium]
MLRLCRYPSGRQPGSDDDESRGRYTSVPESRRDLQESDTAILRPARPVRSARVIAPLLAAGLTYATSQTSIVPALPHIQRAMDASPAEGAWVITGFFVSSAALTVIAGRLGDMFGKRRALLTILGLFGLGALVCALATSVTMVIAGRIVMGAAGGVFPLAYSLLSDQLPRDRAAFGMGLISSAFGLGGALGMPTGGLITDRFGHGGLFWGTVLLTCLSLITVAVLVPEDKVRTRGHVDWSGAILIATGLGAPLTAISRGPDWGWDSPMTIGLLIVGAVALAALFQVERRSAHPLIHLGEMALRNVWIANAVAFLVTFGQGMSFLLVPQIAQLPTASDIGLGVGAMQAGLFMLPASLTTLLFGPVTGALIPRFGLRLPVIAGSLTTATGLLVLAALAAHPMGLLIGSGMMGIGAGMTFAVLPVLINDAVPPARRGAANGVNTIVRHIAIAISAQVAAVVLVISTPAGSPYPAGSAYAADFLLGAVVGGLALLVVPAVRARVPMSGPSTR